MNATVPAEASATFDYSLTIDERHEPTTLLCGVTIFYHDLEVGSGVSLIKRRMLCGLAKAIMDSNVVADPNPIPRP